MEEPVTTNDGQAALCLSLVAPSFMFVMDSTCFIFLSFSPHNTEGLKVVGPDAPLVAVAGEDLVLPCFIKPNTSAVDLRVEWFKLDGVNSLVHLYNDHEDRNEKQAQAYKRRTSLFKEELQKGNASLKLSDLNVSDEGEYKCFIEDKSWFDDITVRIIVEGKINFFTEEKVLLL